MANSDAVVVSVTGLAVGETHDVEIPGLETGRRYWCTGTWSEPFLSTIIAQPGAGQFDHSGSGGNPQQQFFIIADGETVTLEVFYNADGDPDMGLTIVCYPL